MDHESDKIERLEDRIDQLEALTKKMMPSRRDALKLGGAAAIGAAAMSGTASAGSNQVGTIGDANNLVDIEAEDVTINDTLNGASISGAAQDEALLSDGAGGLTFGSAGGGVPPDFTYQAVSTNRSLGTNFTNNTGRALFVNAFLNINTDVDFYRITMEVDNQKIGEIGGELSNGNFEGSQHVMPQFFVPNGSTYKITSIFGNFDIDEWFEIVM